MTCCTKLSVPMRLKSGFFLGFFKARVVREVEVMQEGGVGMSDGQGGKKI